MNITEVTEAVKREAARRVFFGVRPLKGRKGMTKRKYFTVVDPSDPRYEEAHYELDFVINPMPFQK